MQIDLDRLFPQGPGNPLEMAKILFNYGIFPVAVIRTLLLQGPIDTDPVSKLRLNTLLAFISLALVTQAGVTDYPFDKEEENRVKAALNVGKVRTSLYPGVREMGFVPGAIDPFEIGELDTLPRGIESGVLVMSREISRMAGIVRANDGLDLGLTTIVPNRQELVVRDIGVVSYLPVMSAHARGIFKIVGGNVKY